MALFRKWFGGRSKQPITYSEFWQWFTSRADGFSEVLARIDEDDVEVRRVVSAISGQLGRIRSGYFFEVGKMDATTSELVISASGHIENIVFVEELIDAAPHLKGWTFTAHKQANEGGSILLSGHEYSEKTITFLPVLNPENPEQCVIAFYRCDGAQVDQDDFENGVMLFVENVLGDLDSIELIDECQFDSNPPTGEIPRHFDELSPYLHSRKASAAKNKIQVHRDTQGDECIFGKREYQNGFPALMTFNPTLLGLGWNEKATYPWIACITFSFEGNPDNGLPTQHQFDDMMNFQLSLEEQLRDVDGYLSVGRFSRNHERLLFYACHEFRRASKYIEAACKKPTKGIAMTYKIFKDTVWEFSDFFDFPIEEQ